jgi:iron complex outermembrane recepter protein
MTTAITGVCYAQTAPQPGGGQTTPPATGAQPAQPQPATPGASSSNFGTVYATEPAKPSVALAQPGLTASPTDYGALLQRAAATNGQPASTATGDVKVTPGGVTRQDIGGGYMIVEQATKTRSTVTRDAIDKLQPTANPYQMINLLPGVIQSSTDNTGLNGGNIRIRGFNSDHIGLTIEGMPVNDSGNYALYPQEYVDAENIAQISIAQGTPDLDSPHIGSTGGVINILMRDPAKTAGALMDFSMGSNNLRREFVRVDSGEINNVRAFVSYSNLQKDNWAGVGKDDREHIDFKVVWDISTGNTVRFSAIYNSAENNFYRNPTLAQFNTPGYKPAYLASLPTSFFNTTSPIDQSANSAFDYYKYRINPFKNLILSAPSNFTISENLKFDTIPYYWYGYGNGGSTTTMSESGMFWGNLKITNVNYGGTSALSDKILYYNPSITETNRPGIIDKLTYTVGDHQIVAGHWFEYAMHRQTAPFVPLNADGSVQDGFAESNNLIIPSTAVCTYSNAVPGHAAGSSAVCPTGAMQRRDTDTTTMTNMFFIGDTWKATDRLTLIYGVRQIFADRTVDNLMPYATVSSDTLHDSATLPTVGARYKLDHDNTVFASFGTSFRTAPNYTLAQSFSSTSASVAPINVPPPEEGKTFEIGHRFQGSLFSTSVSGFLGLYDNFQQTTNIMDPSGGTSTFSVTRNVGGLMNYGIDAEIGTRPYHNFRPYVSGELLHTELLDNMPTTAKLAGVNIADYLPSKGKELPGAPNYSAGVGIDYDDGHWFGNLGFKYIGAQYSTYVNDEKIPSFGRMDAAVGYRFPDVAGFKQPEIKLNFFNILNTRDLTGVNSYQLNAQDTIGVLGGTIAKSTPNYYMGQDFSFMLTLRTGL